MNAEPTAICRRGLFKATRPVFACGERQYFVKPDFGHRKTKQ
jgi:hypothetical protein